MGNVIVFPVPSLHQLWDIYTLSPRLEMEGNPDNFLSEADVTHAAWMSFYKGGGAHVAAPLERAGGAHLRARPRTLPRPPRRCSASWWRPAFATCGASVLGSRRNWRCRESFSLVLRPGAGPRGSHRALPAYIVLWFLGNLGYFWSLWWVARAAFSCTNITLMTEMSLYAVFRSVLFYDMALYFTLSL